MGIENFIRDALHQPSDYTAYHVARKLAELHPGKTILEGADWEFDLEAFVRDGRCSVVDEKSVFNHTRSDWESAGKKLKRRTRNAWFDVLWSGQLLDVLLITYAEGQYCFRHHWIIADSSAIAEKFYDAVCGWSCEVRGEILVYENGYFDKNKELFDSIKGATFDNLVLSHSLKQQIQDDFKQFFASRETYERYGIPWRRGSLFIGPPGNGKTHTVKALINSLGQPCIYVRGFTGDGTEQENMAEVFNRARMAPCLVVLEDLDSMISGANRAFFLNELDGFKANTGVAVLATTNHPEKLDVSILDRPSRFDRKYYFNLPAATERSAYIQKWNSELQPELRVSDITAVVNKTDGFSFAYLKELFVSAMVQWISNDGKTAMAEVILRQVELLGSQMNNKKEEKETKKKNWFARLVTHRVDHDVDADLVSR